MPLPQGPAGMLPASTEPERAVRELHTPEERDDPSSVTQAPDHWSGTYHVVQVRPHVWNWLAPRVGGGSVLEIGPGSDPRLPWRPRPSSTLPLTRSSDCPPVAAARRRSATALLRIDSTPCSPSRWSNTSRTTPVSSVRWPGSAGPTRCCSSRPPSTGRCGRRSTTRAATSGATSPRCCSRSPRGRLRDWWSDVGPCRFRSSPGSGQRR